MKFCTNLALAVMSFKIIICGDSVMSGIKTEDTSAQKPSTCGHDVNRCIKVSVWFPQ